MKKIIKISIFLLLTSALSFKNSSATLVSRGSYAAAHTRADRIKKFLLLLSYKIENKNNTSEEKEKLKIALKTLTALLNGTKEECKKIIAKYKPLFKMNGPEAKVLLARVAEFSKYEATKMLLKAGVDPNAKNTYDIDERTPLHNIATTLFEDFESLKTLKLLIKNSKDINVKNKNNDTPLDFFLYANNYNRSESPHLKTAALYFLMNNAKSKEIKLEKHPHVLPDVQKAFKILKNNTPEIADQRLKKQNLLNRKFIKLYKQLEKAYVPQIKCGIRHKDFLERANYVLGL